MKDKPNGNGSKKSWLKEGLDNLTGKVGTLVGQGEILKSYMKTCQERHTTSEAAIKNLELNKAIEKGIEIGRKAAYNGVDRRRQEKRNRILVLVAVLTIVGGVFVYGVSAFHSMEKSIEGKISHMIDDKVTQNKTGK